MKYEHQTKDYMITHVGQVIDWDNLISHYLLRHFISKNCIVFVPIEYFYQILYWAWDKRIINLNEMNSQLEEIKWGPYKFQKAVDVQEPTFNPKTVSEENGEIEIIYGEHKIEGNISCFQIAIREQ